MSEIRFEFECWEPFGDVEVIAGHDGSGILVIDKMTGDEIEFERLRASDQSRIKGLVKEWVDHYKAMDSGLHDPHPSNDHFGPAYVDSLNKDMGK